MRSSLIWCVHHFFNTALVASQSSPCAGVAESDAGSCRSALDPFWAEESEEEEAALSLLQLAATHVRRAQHSESSHTASNKLTASAAASAPHVVDGAGLAFFQVDAEKVVESVNSAELGSVVTKEVNEIISDTADLTARAVDTVVEPSVAIYDTAFKVADSAAFAFDEADARPRMSSGTVVTVVLCLIVVLMLSSRRKGSKIEREEHWCPSRSRGASTCGEDPTGDAENVKAATGETNRHTGEVGDKSGANVTSKTPGVREHIEALPLCRANEVDSHLPTGSCGYDCAIGRPISSGQLLRLEGRVEGPVAGGCLTSPLGGHQCVLFVADVSRRVQDGTHPMSVASSSASVDFMVTLNEGDLYGHLYGPRVRIEVSAEDVLLFDMEDGRCTSTMAFEDAPNHWQGFALAGCGRGALTPCAGNGPAPMLVQDNASTAGGATLEFKECALVRGARVTLVGELHRRGDGTLFLQGFNPDGSSKKREKCDRPCPEALRGKVLVSDCADLCSSEEA